MSLIDYELKYIKYKQKYIMLKNNFQGGGRNKRMDYIRDNIRDDIRDDIDITYNIDDSSSTDDYIPDTFRNKRNKKKLKEPKKDRDDNNYERDDDSKSSYDKLRQRKPINLPAVSVREKDRFEQEHQDDNSSLSFQYAQNTTRFNTLNNKIRNGIISRNRNHIFIIYDSVILNFYFDNMPDTYTIFEVFETKNIAENNKSESFCLSKNPLIKQFILKKKRKLLNFENLIGREIKKVKYVGDVHLKTDKKDICVKNHVYKIYLVGGKYFLFILKVISEGYNDNEVKTRLLDISRLSEVLSNSL